MFRFVTKRTFKMETVKDVRSMLRPGVWGATIDLQDAYYHISELSSVFINDKTTHNSFLRH